jgi:hypothetical protein
MQRSRLAVVAVATAAVLALAPPRATASPAALWSGLAGTLASSAVSWQPWSLLREWLGRLRIDEGCSRDPNGHCTSGSRGVHWRP